jgi:Tol biopolymer transport system component
VSPDGQWLYFDSDRNGNQDIFRIPAAGGDLQQLTTNPGDDFYPDVSPDGKEVVFHGVREQGRRAVLIIPATGGPERIVHAGRYQDRVPRWSHDGRAVAFAQTEAPASESGLYVVRRNGDGTWGSARRIYDDANWGAWIPGDSSLVINGTPWLARPLKQDSFTLVPAAGGAPALISAGLDSIRFQSVVPIPGTRTLGIKAVLNDGTAGFWLLPVSGGKARLAVHFDDPNRLSTRVEWASDGRYLYFTAIERESDIYVAELGTTARP